MKLRLRQIKQFSQTMLKASTEISKATVEFSALTFPWLPAFLSNLSGLKYYLVTYWLQGLYGVKDNMKPSTGNVSKLAVASCKRGSVNLSMAK